jgi:hypothetical protein
VESDFERQPDRGQSRHQRRVSNVTNNNKRVIKRRFVEIFICMWKSRPYAQKTDGLEETDEERMGGDNAENTE